MKYKFIVLSNAGTGPYNNKGLSLIGEAPYVERTENLNNGLLNIFFYYYL